MLLAAIATAVSLHVGTIGTAATAQADTPSMPNAVGAPFTLKGAGFNIRNTSTSSITLEAATQTSWAVRSGTDVTAWLVNTSGGPAFSNTSGVASASRSSDGRRLTVKVQASKIQGFTANGPARLAILPPAGALTPKAGSPAYLPTQVNVGSYTVPKLTVTSNLYGSAFTNSKSTLKEGLGGVVEYAKGSKATIALDLKGLSSSRIDSSKAKVALIEGDGYLTSEYLLKATKLGKKWSGGKLGYQLSKGDLVINTGGYPIADTDSGREWSCLGGDGHGNYWFNLAVSGIRYNGLPVASQTFRVHVYIYGQDYYEGADQTFGDGIAVVADIAPLSEKVADPPSAGPAPVWTHLGAGDKPNLVDHVADDFYVTWPSGVDASALESGDVAITLRSAKGDTLALKPGTDFVVDSSAGETQIAVTYLNWPFIPVYSSMSLTVNPVHLAGATPATGLQQTYDDIASVYAYMAQQGGGGTTIEGTVTAYSFYGLANLTARNQVFTDVAYTLRATVDGATVYYAEDGDGKAGLVSAVGSAKTYDGNGEKDRNLRLIGNTGYITARVNAIVEKPVDGATISFTKVYSGGAVRPPTTADSGLKALPGYAIPWTSPNWLTHEKWAWQRALRGVGWIGLEPVPHGARFTQTVRKGATQQFTVTDPSVTWQLVGKVKPGTRVSSSGVLTVAGNETASYFAVAARSTTDKSIRGVGAVSITVQASTATVDKAALQDAIDSASAAFGKNYSSASQRQLKPVLATARSVLAITAASQADVDAATADLVDARKALVPAVTKASVTVSRTRYKVKAAFLPATIAVRVRLADGSSRVLAADEFTVSGFDSRRAGTRKLTVVVAKDLTAPGTRVSATFKVKIVR